MSRDLPSAPFPDNQVDVWCARVPDQWDFDLTHTYQKILSSEESDRYTRFAFEKDRHQFLLTRALVRDVLSRYLNAEPSALVFTRNAYGKPALAEPVGCPVTFSLSHTKGLSVCAVTAVRLVGVDVESLRRANGSPEIANRFFAPAEVAFLGRFNGEQKRTQFLRLWTLKEAFVKACGLGLSLPLHSFAIEILPGQPPSVSYSDGSQYDKADWRFLQIRLGRSYHLAIALSMPEPKEMAIKFSTITPLRGESASILLRPNGVNEWFLDQV